MKQHTQERPVRKTPVEHEDQRPAPRLTLKLEALEQRTAPTVVPPDPLPGI